MASFCLRPTSILRLNLGLEGRLVTPFCTSGTTHLSKSGISVGRSVNKGTCQEFGVWRCGSFWSRSGMMRTAAFRSGEDEEKRIHVFEQEGLIGEDEELMIMGGGLEATLNRLSKWLVSAVFCTIIIWKHDGEAMWLLTGSVINTILSNVLKQILNQDRPVSTLKSDPGMPSSHAQSIFFAAAYVIFSTINWLGVNGLSLVLSSIVFAIGSYLSWLRVSQQFHTIAQVLVGAILGLGFSIFWIWSWHAVIQEAYISLLWVRVFIALGAVGFSIAFVAYVVRHWLKDYT